MHHLANVPAAFNQLQRILVPGGTMILEYANKRHLKNIIRRTLGRNPNPFDEQPYEFAPLHYDFHPRWINHQLASAGFSPKRQLSVSLLRSNFLKRRIKAATLAQIDGWQQQLFSRMAIAPSIFVGMGTQKTGNTLPLPLDELLCCPDCSTNLVKLPQEALHCETCGRDWPIVNGIYVFK
jgi:hypothetical protein